MQGPCPNKKLTLIEMTAKKSRTHLGGIWSSRWWASSMPTSPVAFGPLAGALYGMGTRTGTGGNYAASAPLAFLLGCALRNTDVDSEAPPWMAERGFGMAAPLRAGGAVALP